MKYKNNIKLVLLIAVLSMLINSEINLARSSKDIQLDVDTLISRYGNQAPSQFSSLNTYTDGEFSLRPVMLGGIEYIGRLSVPVSCKLRYDATCNWGSAKLLVFDSVTQDVIYFDFLSEEETIIPLSAGKYNITLIGSWFTGSFQLTYTNATLDHPNV